MRSFFIALAALLAAPTLCYANGSVPEQRAYVAAISHPKGVKVAASTKTAPATTPAPASVAAAPASGGQLTAAQVQTNPLLLLQKFSLADLQAALLDAQAQTPPDATSIPCYQALITLVGSPINSPLPTSPGLFLALQKARDVKAYLANLQSLFAV